MNQKGVHIQIINNILDYCESEWGISAKKTLLKVSKVNIEELEGIQNYTDQEVFYKLLDTIKYDFNQEKKIEKIGEYCSLNIIKNSVYLHPILSQGNPLKFLKGAGSVFMIFFPGCNLEITQIKFNKFYLYINFAKYRILSLFIAGFLNAIIKSFSKKAKILMKKKKEEINKQVIFVLKYRNSARLFENIVLYSVQIFILLIIAAILLYFRTPWIYSILIEILCYFNILSLINIFINNKKNKYNRNLINELHALEKVVLSDKEAITLEILNLKASITKLNEFGNYILQKTDLGEIINSIIGNTATLLGSEKAILFLYDNKTGQFYAKDKSYSDNEIRFFADEDISGKIGKIKKPIILNDPYSNPFFNKEFDKKYNFITKNMIAAPITDNQGDLIGILKVLNKVKNDIYMEIDLSILVSICNYASLAMQNYISMKKSLEDEHKRIMTKLSAYFSTNHLINFISNKNIPSFYGKNQITAKLKQFLWAFDNKLSFKISNKDIDKELNTITNDPKVKLIKLSKYLDQADKTFLYLSLKIMLENSIEAGSIRGEDFSCEIYYSDEIDIPINLRNKYKISSAVNEWNYRKTDIGDSFKTFLSRNYPLLEKDINIIEQSLIYNPKLIFMDNSGGIDKNIEDKIFYPFFTTKNNHDGIGLNILKKITYENNGDIEFKNFLGSGVEITIHFNKRRFL